MNARPKWTVHYNIVSQENNQWVGRGWEFFDDESDAKKCFDRHTLAGNCCSKRPFHENDWEHVGAGHKIGEIAVKQVKGKTTIVSDDKIIGQQG